MRIMYIKRTVRTWGNKIRICFLKALTDSEFRILLSNLFHSIIVDRKEEIRKYSCLTFSKGMLL